MTTLNELVAKYNELATAKGLATRKSFDNKAKAEAAIAALKPAKKGAALRVRKAGAVHQKGPRGFTFGPVWLASIKAGEGVALKAVNLPKLLETAKAFGVSVTADLDQTEVAKLVAKAV